METHFSGKFPWPRRGGQKGSRGPKGRSDLDTRLPKKPPVKTGVWFRPAKAGPPLPRSASADQSQPCPSGRGSLLFGICTWERRSPDRPVQSVSLVLALRVRTQSRTLCQTSSGLRRRQIFHRTFCHMENGSRNLLEDVRGSRESIEGNSLRSNHVKLICIAFLVPHGLAANRFVSHLW